MCDDLSNFKRSIRSCLFRTLEKYWHGKPVSNLKFYVSSGSRWPVVLVVIPSYWRWRVLSFLVYGILKIRLEGANSLELDTRKKAMLSIFDEKLVKCTSEFFSSAVEIRKLEIGKASQRNVSIVTTVPVKVESHRFECFFSK